MTPPHCRETEAEGSKGTLHTLGRRGTQDAAGTSYEERNFQKEQGAELW